MTKRSEGGPVGNQKTRTHGLHPYETRGELPAPMRGFDEKLASELLELAGGAPAFQLLAKSAARRATIIELAVSYLSGDGVNMLWLETNEAGQKVVCWQPLLNRLGSYFEGLRRDLQELGLTPLARARLGVKDGKGFDYEEFLAKSKEGEP